MEGILYVWVKGRAGDGVCTYLDTPFCWRLCSDYSFDAIYWLQCWMELDKTCKAMDFPVLEITCAQKLPY